MTKKRYWFVSLIFVSLLLVSCNGNSTETPAPEPYQLNSVQAAESETYNDMQTGITEDGYLYLGDPNAPVKIEEFSDFLCPFCGRYFQQTFAQVVNKYIKTGKVIYVFRDFPIADLHPNAPTGHKAAWCAAKQNTGYFWQMHDHLFQYQGEWRNLPDPSDYLANLAQGYGLDMKQYQECINASETETRLQNSIQAAINKGFNGTPSFLFVQTGTGEEFTLIGAQPFENFSRMLEPLIAGKAPATEEVKPTEKAELPFWAKPEGLQPDPKRPGFTLGGDAYKGNPDAGLAVAEFSDFQCPACADFAQNIEPALDAEFIQNGKIQWIFKNIPFKEHPQAPVAAVAAECAGEQGRFWEMYQKLFQNMGQWSVETPEPVFMSFANQLDLDEEEFEQCLNSRQAMERILQDMYDGQKLVRAAPTFIIISQGIGRVLKGALPEEQFINLIQDILDDQESNKK